MGDDDAMLDIVTSANVACGFHAGDPTSWRRHLRTPKQRRAVGAHVAFRTSQASGGAVCR
jgi:UPF0271 protein